VESDSGAASGYQLISYAPQKCKNIKVKLRGLTVVETNEEPNNDDTLEFEVGLDIKTDVRDKFLDPAAKGAKVDASNVIKVVVKCEVSNKAPGADGIAIDCKPTTMEVTVKGQKVPVTVKFPADQDKFTAGIAIVK
jgi:hypothetical protein